MLIRQLSKSHPFFTIMKYIYTHTQIRYKQVNNRNFSTRPNTSNQIENVEINKRSISKYSRGEARENTLSKQIERATSAS